MSPKITGLFRAAACLTALLTLAACAGGDTPPLPGPSASGSAQVSLEPSQAPSDPPAASPEPTPEPSPEPSETASPEPSTPPYEFGVPLAETAPVADDSFFDDAVFLGDSRTEGLDLFSGLTHGDFYWARGMTVFRADSSDYQLFEVDGEQLTLVGTLSKKTYGKVYIMIGINELGYPISSFENGLRTLVDKVIAAQPTAVIYLQVLPPVNEVIGKSKGQSSYINNQQVDAFNEIIVETAAEKHVALLDMTSAFRDSDGQLSAELTSDGVHFTVKGYVLWADFLRCHMIEPEQYFYSREVVAP